MKMSKKLKCHYLKLVFFLRYKLIPHKIHGGYLICPNCGRISVCPCKACKTARKTYNITKFKEFEWVNGELVKCPHCGFTAHIDYWAFDGCLSERIYI